LSIYRKRIDKVLLSNLKKISKKDRKLFDAAMKKIDEISANPQHYKPLRYDLKGWRRVHLEKSFVLVFRIDEEEKIVTFLDLRHHDEIYRRK
jgi:YafQ family addiction module toxin component